MCHFFGVYDHLKLLYCISVCKNTHRKLSFRVHQCIWSCNRNIQLQYRVLRSYLPTYHFYSHDKVSVASKHSSSQNIQPTLILSSKLTLESLICWAKHVCWPSIDAHVTIHDWLPDLTRYGFRCLIKFGMVEPASIIWTAQMLHFVWALCKVFIAKSDDEWHSSCRHAPHGVVLSCVVAAAYCTSSSVAATCEMGKTRVNQK